MSTPLLHCVFAVQQMLLEPLRASSYLHQSCIDRSIMPKTKGTADLPMFPHPLDQPKFERAAAYAVDVWTTELGKQEKEKALGPLTFADVWWIYERLREEEEKAQKKAEVVEEKRKMDALSTPHTPRNCVVTPRVLTLYLSLLHERPLASNSPCMQSLPKARPITSLRPCRSSKIRAIFRRFPSK